MSIVVYGIGNCDTVKKARAWLDLQGVAHGFHDFKRTGLQSGLLDDWIAQVGWEVLLNRQGTTWRKLDDTRRAGCTDAAAARTLMLDQPSLVKRPVMRWPSGPVSVGFDPVRWAARLDADAVTSADRTGPMPPLRR